MDKRGKRQSASIFGGMGFYIALSVCVIAAGVVGYVTLTSEDEPTQAPVAPVADVVSDPAPEETPSPPTVPVTAEREDTQSVSSDEPLVVTYPLEKPPASTEGASFAEPAAGEAEIPAPAPEEAAPTAEAAPVSGRIVCPLAGETVAVFSADRLMYDPTLDDWRTHDGIDISAEAGTPVVSAAAGIVQFVGEDERLGVTVRVEHPGGYVTTYASLHPETLVDVGQNVEAGETIARVGNTSLSEAAQGAHLHFSVSRNGVSIDPAVYLPGES